MLYTSFGETPSSVKQQQWCREVELITSFASILSEFPWAHTQWFSLHPSRNKVAGYLIGHDNTDCKILCLCQATGEISQSYEQTLCKGKEG